MMSTNEIMKELVLDGQTLTPDDVVRAARGDGTGAWPKVSLGEDARRITEEVRAYVEKNWLTDEAPPIYGINTGLGRLRDVRISAADFESYQRHIIESHSAGIGEPITEEQARATMVLRVNALAKGCSGLRVACLDRLLAMLNAGIHPVIPSQGSVGASGDLAPLAHLVTVMVGHPKAEAFYKGQRMAAADAFAAAGLPTDFDLKPKDVLALINGSTVALGISILALADAKLLAKNADIALALSVEAMRGELNAFDERIHQVRNCPMQVLVSGNVLKVVSESQWTTEEARQVKLPDEVRPNDIYVPRVQDPYSLRCAPQVHGAARDALLYAETLLGREANAATDNPLIFPDGKGDYVVLSGGNFHGEPIGYAADLIALAVAEIGAISERRSYRLTDPTMSYGLPLNLVGGMLGLNTGFSLVHCSAAALASENKVLCFPSVADSLPTKANQEDHVSMCTFSARKAVMVVKNTSAILAVEFLCAAQGIDLASKTLGERKIGTGSAAAKGRLRNDIDATGEDHYQSSDMYVAQELVRSGALVAAVETAIGAIG
ncbi:MAG TPA: histidine ammonia-lyase [Novosphingobium sp.]|nr:histidine ammonia-lyase [Novosphingobium sp.]